MIPKLDAYMAEEEKDFAIDKAHLTSCLMNLPIIHAKWLRRLINEQALFIKMDAARRKMFRDKHEYYSSQYKLEIKPNHLLWYVEADPDYSKMLFKIDVQKKIIDYLERIVQRIKDHNYIIRNIQDWEKFKAGV